MVAQFGKLPSGRRLERILKSIQYREGKFHNLYETKMFSDDASFASMLIKFFSNIPGREPSATLPVIKSDLKSIPATYPVVVWFGHSSYFIKINGKNILVDPVFSDHASPFSWVGKKAFPVSYQYSVDDLPEIDLVILTHDHYDHLDYKTLKLLQPIVKEYYTSLGVGEHLVQWGVPEDSIVELDWWEHITHSYGIDIIATPARHFSGRALKRNQSLWSGFVLKTQSHALYLGGDSGYDGSFKLIGERHGPFDLAVLECGQYNNMWPHIHMMPEEVAQAAIDLQAKAFMPVHWGKFTLSLHRWNEPIERVSAKATELNIPMTTPMIGELVVLDHPLPQAPWWKDVV